MYAPEGLTSLRHVPVCSQQGQDRGAGSHGLGHQQAVRRSGRDGRVVVYVLYGNIHLDYIFAVFKLVRNGHSRK